MKLLLSAAVVLATASLTAPAQAQVHVQGGVTVTVNQPGVYGRVVLGHLPPPPVILPQPVIIHHTPVAMHAQPVYLYVPPGHQKKWHKHCHRYNACGQQVYFVQERWVHDRYAQSRQDTHHHDRGDPGRGYGHGRGHGDDRGDGDDRGHKKDRGHKDDHGRGQRNGPPVYVQSR